VPSPLLLWVTYAFAAAVQPGPLQAYLVSEALRRGWRHTIPATLAPLLSDPPIIAIVLFVLSRVPARLELALRLAGGVFLLYLAGRAFAAWSRASGSPGDGAGGARRTVMSAAAVNLLNPNPWLAWSLVLGPLLLQAWRVSPARGVALLLAFYGTMVACTAGIVILVAGARRLGPRVAHGLVGLSGVALAGFGIWQVWMGAAALLGG
jgi:threonine/homoserine/homoserine lactone efflux protein